MYAWMGTFLTALSALHGDTVHVARFVHNCGNWVKGGGMCRRVGPMEVQFSANFKQNLRLLRMCNQSRSETQVKHKASYNLVTCTR